MLIPYFGAPVLTCPACSAEDLDPANDMCQHRHPLCYGCCLAGEHDWLPQDRGAA